jgi:DNA-binding transcriptional MerR regulator
MVSKLRVQKRLYYKIGEACKELGIQPYVLRYWETEFPALAPSKSRSGQRVYSDKELEIIRRIKELLYTEGYTIAGAKKKLEAELASGGLGEPELGEEAAAAPEASAPARARRGSSRVPQDEAQAPEGAVVDAGPQLPLAASSLGAEDGLALDTDAAERVQRLRSGIERALQEAREILALLDAKSP